jgi:hypothetical protein
MECRSSSCRWNINFECELCDRMAGTAARPAFFGSQVSCLRIVAFNGMLCVNKFRRF